MLHSTLTHVYAYHLTHVYAYHLACRYYCASAHSKGHLQKFESKLNGVARQRTSPNVQFQI